VRRPGSYEARHLRIRQFCFSAIIAPVAEARRLPTPSEKMAISAAHDFPPECSTVYVASSDAR